MIEIWEPRWKDRMVLVSVKKVKKGTNYIKFTRARSLPGTYSFDSAILDECEVSTNGKIDCFLIPLCRLKREDTHEQMSL